MNRKVALRRPALVLRPRRDGDGAQHRPDRRARRRHRRPAPHGLPGRALPRPLRRGDDRATPPPVRRMLAAGDPRRRGHRRHARRQLQPVGRPRLAGLRSQRRRHASCSAPAPASRREQALRLYTAGQRVVLRAKTASGASSPRAAWATSRCCPTTTSWCRRRRSATSPRCSRWSAATSSTPAATSAASLPRRCRSAPTRAPPAQYGGYDPGVVARALSGAPAAPSSPPRPRLRLRRVLAASSAAPRAHAGGTRDVDCITSWLPLKL